MTNDERKALERAQATLDNLTPATARHDAIAFDLRYASRLTAEAAVKGDPALNNFRRYAAAALDDAAGSLDRRTLTQNRIEFARAAVVMVLARLLA